MVNDRATSIPVEVPYKVMIKPSDSWVQPGPLFNRSL